MDWLTIIGIVAEAVGTLLIAYTAFRVHDRVRLEHKIDAKVIKEMERERATGNFGIVLMLGGYLLQIISSSL